MIAEALNVLCEIRNVYYDLLGNLACVNAKGRAYTDHKQTNEEMVLDKPLEADTISLIG